MSGGDLLADHFGVAVQHLLSLTASPIDGGKSRADKPEAESDGGADYGDGEKNADQCQYAGYECRHNFASANYDLHALYRPNFSFYRYYPL